MYSRTDMSEPDPKPTANRARVGYPTTSWVLLRSKGGAKFSLVPFENAPCVTNNRLSCGPLPQSQPHFCEPIRLGCLCWPGFYANLRLWKLDLTDPCAVHTRWFAGSQSLSAQSINARLSAGDYTLHISSGQTHLNSHITHKVTEEETTAWSWTQQSKINKHCQRQGLSVLQINSLNLYRADGGSCHASATLPIRSI